MERIVGAIRFQLVPDAPTPATLRFVERVDDVTLNRDAVQIDESPLRIAASDRLVMRRQLLTNLPTLLRDARSEVARTAARGKKSASADTSITTSALFAVTLADEQRLGADVAEFRANNYHRFADGSMSRRYFRFLLPELWTVLQSRDAEKSVDSPTANGLALVLTGGGVKATYQTRLIDALYGHNKETQADVRLTNDAKIATNSSTTSRPTERVNYVIGTSGGALLGMFVGTLNNSILTQDGWTGLTEMLWRPQGNDLKSTQIFPLLDMLRYFSVLVCFWLLWLVMTVAVHWFGDRWWTHVHVASKAATTTKTTESNNEVIIRWRSESWPWIILLAAAPIIVVQICDRWDLEHVPPIAGVYYTLMAVIAWYSDVSLTPIRQFKWRRARITKIFFALVIVGLACIAIPIGGQWRVEYCEPVPWQINLCFFGFLLLAGACYMFFAQQREYFKHEPWHEGIVMLFGLIGMVLISYLMVWLGVQLRLTAFLELTGGFWQWLLPSMFAFSLLVL
ncbi:MAG TPA: hypothetical protein VET48_12075 [Steroidobacteraceae bacterium]|nr:hypothetical protein [Steroidobacteraceae bacterium]